MPDSELLKTLRWQFDMTWKLAQYHLPTLTDEACLFEPTPVSWTVRKSADGRWLADMSDTEPDPPPTVTIGWLTWHITWWWSGMLAAVHEARPPKYDEVGWPGSAEAAVGQIDDLAKQWSDFLSGLQTSDLTRQLAYPWSDPRPLSVALAWVNSELMKNVAEIGYVRHVFMGSKR